MKGTADLEDAYAKAMAAVKAEKAESAKKKAVSTMHAAHRKLTRALQKDPPPPRFALGDQVEDKRFGLTGVVSYIGQYDRYLGGYRYKVQEPSGRRNYWNEASMVKTHGVTRRQLALFRSATMKQMKTTSRGLSRAAGISRRRMSGF